MQVVRSALRKPVQESSCVYFHNVPFEVNEEDLLPLFERAGPVKALRLFTLKAW